MRESLRRRTGAFPTAPVAFVAAETAYGDPEFAPLSSRAVVRYYRESQALS